GGFGLHSRHREQRGVGQPVGFGPENDDCRRRGFEASLKPVAPCRHARGLRSESFAGRRCRGTKTGDSRHVLGAGPPAALLPAALDERINKGELRAPDQRANTLGGANLVPGQGEEVGAEGVDITRNSTDGLDRGDVQDPPPGRTPPAAWTSCAARGTGWTTPVSLLASMSETRARLPSAARRRSSAARSNVPLPVTGRRSTLPDGNRPPARTEGCS